MESFFRSLLEQRSTDTTHIKAPRLESERFTLSPPKVEYTDNSDDLITDYMDSEEVRRAILYKISNQESVEDYKAKTLYRVFVDESPYVEAIPLWLAVEAYHITWKNLGILYSLYTEMDVFSTKRASKEELIAICEREKNIFRLDKYAEIAVDNPKNIDTYASILQECTRQTLSQILKAHIKKIDLRAFMQRAEIRQVKSVHGLQLDLLSVVKNTTGRGASPKDKKVTPSKRKKEITTENYCKQWLEARQMNNKDKKVIKPEFWEQVKKMHQDHEKPNRDAAYRFFTNIVPDEMKHRGKPTATK